MPRNEWYVLVREHPQDDWTCVPDLSKETALVMSNSFDAQGLNSVIGFSFPHFCGCRPMTVSV